MHGTAPGFSRSGVEPQHLHPLPAPVLYRSSVPSLSREHLAYLSRPGMEMKMKDSSVAAFSHPLSAPGGQGQIAGGFAALCLLQPRCSQSRAPSFMCHPKHCPRMAQLSALHSTKVRSPWCPVVWMRLCCFFSIHPTQSVCYFPDISTYLADCRLLSLVLSKVMFSANSMALEGRDVVTISISRS